MVPKDYDLVPHLFLSPGYGTHFDLLGLQITVKPAPGASFSLFEMTLPPHHAAVSSHFHRATTEWIYILEGALALTLDAETRVARAGSLIWILPGSAHAFWNPTGAPVRCLGYHSSPDDGEYLGSLAGLIAQATPWPPADTSPFLMLAAQYDRFLTPSRLPTGKASDAVIP